jgi:hypothetical protein
MLRPTVSQSVSQSFLEQSTRHLWACFLENMETSTFHYPMGFHGPLQGAFTLYVYTKCIWEQGAEENICSEEKQNKRWMEKSAEWEAS